MSIAYELSHLNPATFENLVNLIAMKMLGMSATGFGPGADGGRDGYFEGEAPYPNDIERWSGTWYIQSKFKRPGGQKPDQQWLIEQVKQEIAAFDQEDGDRIWPSNWIIATNVEVSGKPGAGSFDAIKKLIKGSSRGKSIKFDIWDGKKILNILSEYESIAKYYGHFLTPGHIISRLYDELAALSESRATVAELIRYFVVTQFSDHLYTKLEQAGASSATRPAVHDLFIDLPYTVMNQGAGYSNKETNLLSALCTCSAQSHKYSLRKTIPEGWRQWARHPKRARVTLIKGGPGQGKSTIGQYLSQIQRASLILGSDGPPVSDAVRDAAVGLRAAAETMDLWPQSARIPVQIELKEYAHWHSQQSNEQSCNVLTYLAFTVSKKTGTTVLPKTIKNAFSTRAWLVIFDGLDEVPNDYKSEVAKEILYFVNDVSIEIDGDVFTICTSRPQGYSGQFSAFDGAEVQLAKLGPQIALTCAKPVLSYSRSSDEIQKSVEVLETAIQSANIQELMTTPLQAHIMAVIVREGGKPPERRWRLFQTFYQVMKRRESMKDFKDRRIAELFEGEDRLLKAVHMRLGFVLHARAEQSAGAQTVLSRREFHDLVEFVVRDLGHDDVAQTVEVVMEATTERLVLVSTPDNAEQVRFDIRQLQEFFAAEFLYDGTTADALAKRIEVLGTDAHWREVMHFLMSAFIADRRTTELAVAVQELTKLNEGDVNDSCKLYRRRAGPGTLLSVRLLTEGVLENDQKDRRNLKPLIAKIGAIYDLAVLIDLVNLQQKNSKQWLIDVLIESVECSAPSEYAGALFVLGWLLDDQSLKTDLVINAFQSLPINIQETLFRQWGALIRENGPEATDESENVTARLGLWVIVSSFKILNSEKWSDYNSSSLESMIELLRLHKENFIVACHNDQVSQEVAKAIYECMFVIDKAIRLSKISAKESWIHCGVISAMPYPYNWKNGKSHRDWKNFHSHRFVGYVNGVFRLVMVCLWFGTKRNITSFQEFIKIARKIDFRKLSVLSPALLALVPVSGNDDIEPFSTSHLKEDLEIGELKDYLNTLAGNISSPIADYRLHRDAFMTDDDWTAFARNLPAIAIHVAFEPDENLLKSGQTIFVSELEALILGNPEVVAEYILRWGYLLGQSFSLLENIRSAVVYNKINIYENKHAYSHRIIPFILRLPEELPLLPLLAAALYTWRRGSREYFDLDFIEESSGSPFVLMINKFGLEPENLRKIAINKEFPKIIRAGAAAIHWFCVAESNDLKSVVSKGSCLYNEVVENQSELWLTGAAIDGVLASASDEDVDALYFVEQILHCDADARIREEITRLFYIWREKSHAPVTTKKLLASWLGYSNDVPTYAKTA